MVAADEITGMRRQGRTDDEIVMELKKSGMSDRDAYDALSRSQIKAAVSSRDDDGQPPLPQMPDPSRDQMYPQQYSAPPEESEEEYGPAQGGRPATTEYGGDYGGMQPSMLSQGESQTEYAQPQEQNYAQGYDSGGGGYSDAGYPEYQPYQEAMSSDMISEISEQVVSERLAPLHDRLEKVIDMKTVFEARITSLSERLVRMEKIIDTLQLSLLQKVGEYVNDVHDVRKELEETQKSFSTLHRHTPHKGEHHSDAKKHKKR